MKNNILEMGIFSGLFGKKKEKIEEKAEEVKNNINEVIEEPSVPENIQEENTEVAPETPSAPQAETVEDKPEAKAAYETPEEHNEETYLARAKQLVEADELYVLLSVSKANMLEGFSFPYVGNLGEGKLTLYVFSTYELAKQFVLGSDYEVLDGIYPIGKLDKKDQFSTLINTLIITKKIMKVDYFDIDGVASYDIAWFLEANEVKEYQVKIHLTNKEMEEAKANNGQPPKLPTRFNPVQITNFSNPFIITEGRRKELLDSVFIKEGQPREDHINNFVQKQSLMENCFILTVVFLSYMPQAEKAQKEDDLKYFQGIRNMLSAIIWMKLHQERNLFTLVNAKTKEPVLQNESMCVITSERFKYISPECELVPLAGTDQIKEYIQKYNLKAIVLDGITTTAVLDANNCN